MRTKGRKGNYEVRRVTAWIPAPGVAASLRVAYYLFHTCLSRQVTRTGILSTKFTLIFLGPGPIVDAQQVILKKKKTS